MSIQVGSYVIDEVKTLIITDSVGNRAVIENPSMLPESAFDIEAPKKEIEIFVSEDEESKLDALLKKCQMKE